MEKCEQSQVNCSSFFLILTLLLVLLLLLFFYLIAVSSKVFLSQPMVFIFCASNSTLQPGMVGGGGG